MNHLFESLLWTTFVNHFCVSFLWIIFCESFLWMIFVNNSWRWFLWVLFVYHFSTIFCGFHFLTFWKSNFMIFFVIHICKIIFVIVSFFFCYSKLRIIFVTGDCNHFCKILLWILLTIFLDAWASLGLGVSQSCLCTICLNNCLNKCLNN